MTTTAILSGDFNLASNWDNGVPTIGSDFVIPAGITMTHTDGTTITAGPDGGNGVAAGLIKSGGSLIITDSGLTVRGDINIERGGLCELVGTADLTLDAPTDVCYYWGGSSTGTGQGTLKTTIADGNIPTVRSGSRGGYGRIGRGASDLYLDLLFEAIRLVGLGGDASTTYHRALYWYGFAAAAQFVVGLLLAVDCGDITVAPVASGSVESIGDIVIVNPLYDKSFVQATGSGSVTIGRVFAYSPNIRGYIAVQRSNTTLPEVYSYRSQVSIESGAVGVTVGKMLNLVDNPSGGVLTLPADAGVTVAQLIAVGDDDNHHWIVESASVGGDKNRVLAGFCDGAGVNNAEKGEIYNGMGSFRVQNLVSFNGDSSLGSMLSSSVLAEFVHCTAIGVSGCNTGETYGGATQLQIFRDNLLVNMTDGLHQNSAFVPQSDAYIGYNGFWGMAGANISHPLLGENSYMAAESFDSWFASGTFDGTNGRGLGDVHADPAFVDDSATVLGYFEAASIQAAGQAVFALSGYDYEGNATTVPDKTFDTAWTYLSDAFSPTNTAYQGVASDGGDIGALSVTVLSGIDAFAASKTSGAAPFNTTFEWALTGTPDTVTLDPGDGSGATDVSGETSLAYTYTTAGLYMATLAATFDGTAIEATVDITPETPQYGYTMMTYLGGTWVETSTL